MQGWLNIYKERNISSFQALLRVKKKLAKLSGEKIKIGHAGTLDPFACGILPVALGQTCKLISLLHDKNAFIANSDDINFEKDNILKSYYAVMSFGKKTDTGDIKGEIIAQNDKYVSEKRLRHKLKKFSGVVYQKPHKFSAVKINGKRAYKLAREGKNFSMPEKKIYIEQINIVKKLSNSDYLLHVICQKGVYIRSLIEDIAAEFGLYAYTKYLERAEYGLFNKSNSIKINQLEQINTLQELKERLFQSDRILDEIPVTYVTGKFLNLLRNGVKVRDPDFLSLYIKNNLDFLQLQNGKEYLMTERNYFYHIKNFTSKLLFSLKNKNNDKIILVRIYDENNNFSVLGKLNKNPKDTCLSAIKIFNTDLVE